MNAERQTETYVVRRPVGGRRYGTYAVTECGNLMYSVTDDPMVFHGVRCPKCYQQGKRVMLIYKGSIENDKVD